MRSICKRGAWRRGCESWDTARRMHSSSPWKPVAEARKQDSLLRGPDLHSSRLPFWTAPPVLRHALTRSWVRLAKPTELMSSRWIIVSKPGFSQLLAWSQGDAHTMIEESSSIASGLRDVRPLCEARLGRIRAALSRSQVKSEIVRIHSWSPPQDRAPTEWADQDSTF